MSETKEEIRRLFDERTDPDVGDVTETLLFAARNTGHPVGDLTSLRFTRRTLEMYIQDDHMSTEHNTVINEALRPLLIQLDALVNEFLDAVASVAFEMQDCTCAVCVGRSSAGSGAGDPDMN